jgi:hypothetical protein
MAAVNLLLFGEQGGLDLMLLDNHGDCDVYSHTKQTRPQAIAPLPWKSLYFVLRDAITEWLYGWRSPTMTRDSCSRTLTGKPETRTSRASQGRIGVARWMLVLTFANTGPTGSHFCPCLPAAAAHPRLISSRTLLPTSHFSLRWP